MPFKMQSRRVGSLSFLAVAVAHELFREGRADGGVAGGRLGGSSRAGRRQGEGGQGMAEAGGGQGPRAAPCCPCTEPQDSEDRPEETLRAIFSSGVTTVVCLQTGQAQSN